MRKQLFVDHDGRLKPWILYASIAVAVVAGSYLVYAAWRGDDQPFQATLMCGTPGCGHVRTAALEVGEMVPARCPKCEKMSLLPAFRCPQCKAVNIWNESRGLPPPTKCTKCGQEVQHGR